MNLYIVRHAIAVEHGTPGYEDDSQRPLTDNGRKKMKKISRRPRSTRHSAGCDPDQPLRACP